MAKQVISTVFLDAGDTLIRVREPLFALYAQVISRHKTPAFSPEQVRAAMDAQLAATPMVVEGHFRYSDGWFEWFIAGLMEKLECPRPWDDIRQGLFDLFDDPNTFAVFPDVVPCLEWLRQAGLKAAVVSNWGCSLPGLFKRLRLAGYFETIIASANVRIEKPDQGIFEHALELTGSRPETTLHVGDSFEADVLGARAAGLHSLLLDRKDQIPFKNDKIISLSEIPKRLARQLI